MTTALATTYELLRVYAEGRVGVIQLYRPKALNALNSAIMAEVTHALAAFDADDTIGCIVLTGDERAFAAGADIKELADATPIDLLTMESLSYWDRVAQTRKPLIAAVSGHCLGGGCELAMCCDMIVASETARFGQPEIAIGVMPGAGGTQRLTRALGKARAMELILTGESFGVQEALRAGLVNRVVPVELYLDEAISLGARIAAMPPLAVRLAKQAVLAVDDTHLPEGLQRERQAFYLLFASEDQKEGMAAFVQKRPARWKGR